MGERGGPGRQRAQMRALAPTGTAPAETLISVGDVEISEARPQSERQEEHAPILKTMRIYPFGVNRDRLEQAARQLRVPIIVTKNQGDANAVVTLKNYYRRQPERLQQAEDERKTIIILKNNTISQMQHALAHIFDIPLEQSVEDEDEDGDEGTSEAVNFPNETATVSDAQTQRAMLETEDAIHQLLNRGLTTAELAPANAYIRRLQHQMATRYNLISRSRGKEPNRRVKLFRAH
jgi:hypothetical protein